MQPDRQTAPRLRLDSQLISRIPFTLMFLGIVGIFIYTAFNMIVYGQFKSPLASPQPTSETIKAEIIQREEVQVALTRGNLATPERFATEYYLTFEYLHRNEPARRRVRVSEAVYNIYEEGSSIDVIYSEKTGDAALPISAATTNPGAAARSATRDTMPRVFGVFFLGIALFMGAGYLRGFVLPHVYWNGSALVSPAASRSRVTRVTIRRKPSDYLDR